MWLSWRAREFAALEELPDAESPPRPLYYRYGEWQCCPGLSAVSYQGNHHLCVLINTQLNPSDSAQQIQRTGQFQRSKCKGPNSCVRCGKAVHCVGFSRCQPAIVHTNTPSGYVVHTQQSCHRICTDGVTSNLPLIPACLRVYISARYLDSKYVIVIATTAAQHKTSGETIWWQVRASIWLTFTQYRSARKKKSTWKEVIGRDRWSYTAEWSPDCYDAEVVTWSP